MLCPSPPPSPPLAQLLESCDGSGEDTATAAAALTRGSDASARDSFYVWLLATCDDIGDEDSSAWQLPELYPRHCTSLPAMPPMPLFVRPMSSDASAAAASSTPRGTSFYVPPKWLSMSASLSSRRPSDSPNQSPTNTAIGGIAAAVAVDAAAAASASDPTVVVTEQLRAKSLRRMDKTMNACRWGGLT